MKKSFFIGQYKIDNCLLVAPMAGVTDQPFRKLCRKMGASYTVSEMISAEPELRQTKKTLCRTNHNGELTPIVVQLVGHDPKIMHESTHYNIGRGAQIIDINMGCPAKKVCKVLSGSALLRDLTLVEKILKSVIDACNQYKPNIPVTLKTRTGWNHLQKNIVDVAKLAENLGIAMLVIHGRTREDFYHGSVDYETIAKVKQAVNIPVIANGNIDSPEKAKTVFKITNADGIMIGRAAQGRPWLFREISHFLNNQTYLPNPEIKEIQEVIIEHMKDHYLLYGEELGVKTVRKHISWYVKKLKHENNFCKKFFLLDKSTDQLEEVNNFFENQKLLTSKLEYQE